MSVPDRDQRTLEPSPKRVDEFRKRGEIALSRDLTNVATMVAGAIVGLMMAKRSVHDVATMTSGYLEALSVSGRTIDQLLALFVHAGAIFALACAPVAIGALLGYALSTALQLGFPPVFVRPKFDLARLFSIQQLGNLFSPKESAGRALKATAKLAVVGGALLYALMLERDEFQQAPALDALALVARLLSSLLRLSTYAGSALMILAVADYLYTRREIRARMRMTPEEMKREMKDSDGDPLIRRKRKQRMRELAKQRLNQAVKGADVVLVNPTEYAVALRYRSEDDRAPRVVAKGRGALAERIREIARNAGVPIMPQPPLARLLYKVVPEGREIPANLYRAVAEVLAHVYRLKRRAAR